MKQFRVYDGGPVGSYVVLVGEDNHAYSIDSEGNMYEKAGIVEAENVREALRLANPNPDKDDV